MEWCIPIQTFQVENVQLGTLTTGPKPLVPLAYKDTEFTFPSLVFLLSPLKIKSYDPVSGRLVLCLVDSPQVLSKLLMLQEMLLSAISINQTTWFKSNPRRIAELRSGFQPMIHNNEMHVYCPNQNYQAQGPNIYINNTWVKAAGLVSGMKIRIIIKLQGISFHIHQPSGQWSGKFRLQHRIIGVLVNNEELAS
jgi:hypothetical protein